MKQTVTHLRATANRMFKNGRLKLNQKVLRDPPSRLRFRRHTPPLSEAQTRILRHLRADGIALIPIADLFGERAEATWTPLAAAADAFARSAKVQRRIVAFQQELAAWPTQQPDQRTDPCDFVDRDDGCNPPFDPDDPLLRLPLDPLILDTVNTYFQFRSKLKEVNLAYKIPHVLKRPADISVALWSRIAEMIDQPLPVGAQTWHRDEWYQVKVFLYFSEVNADNGVLEYIRGSIQGGPNAHLWRLPDGFHEDYYLKPPQGHIEAALAPEDRMVCAGPRGTLVFCDTSGLHRGGFARRTPRILATWGFYPPAMTVTPRSFHLTRPLASLSPAAAYALA